MVEKIAQLRDSRTTWQVINRVDLAPLWESIQHTQKRLEWFESRKAAANQFYRIEAPKLRARINQVASEFTKICPEIEDRLGRFKRAAPLMIVGKIMSLLFGTMTEQDKDELQFIIEQSTNNSNQIAKLLALQTEVIHNQLSGMMWRQNFTEQQLQNLTIRQSTAETEIAFLQLLEEFIEQITYLERQMSILEETTMLASSGFIHPLMLSEEQLENSVGLIKIANLNAEFPLAQTKFSVIDLTRIATLVVYISQNVLVYIIKIPLLTKVRFELLKLYEIPIKQKFNEMSNIYASLTTESEFIALTDSKSEFIRIDALTLQNCKSLKEVYICQNLEPLHKIGPHSSCDIKVAANSEIDISQCNFNIKKIKDTFWKKMNSKNTWIFSTAKKEELFIACRGEDPQSVALPEKPGILSLKPGCEAKTSSARLTATRVENLTINVRIYDRIRSNTDFIISSTAEGIKSEVETILQNELEHKNFENDSFTAEKTLNDIIQEAKVLSDFKLIKAQLVEYKSNVGVWFLILISATILALVATIFCKIYTCSKYPLLPIINCCHRRAMQESEGNMKLEMKQIKAKKIKKNKKRTMKRETNGSSGSITSLDEQISEKQHKIAKCSHCGEDHYRAECEMLNKTKAKTDDERSIKSQKCAEKQEELQENTIDKEKSHSSILLNQQDEVIEFKRGQKFQVTLKSEPIKQAKWHVP